MNFPIADKLSLGKVGIPGLLTLLLALSFALTLAFTQVVSSVLPVTPAGFAPDKTWLSVSRGEPNAIVGMLRFSHRQIESIDATFPQLSLIAASGAVKTELIVDGQRRDAWVEFVNPKAFIGSGVRIGRAPLGDKDSFCIPSERWLRAQGDAPASIGVGESVMPLIGSVDARLRMFAGLEAAEIWCSWDTATGVLVPIEEKAQAKEVPLYGLFVGSTDQGSLLQWRERSRSIELPMTMARGVEREALTSLDGWVTHPAIQREAVERAFSLSLLARGFLLFSIGLVIFVSFARVRRNSVGLKVRYAIGARRGDILLPSALMHLRAFLASLLIGGGAAKAMAAALWQDPVLAVARISGEPLFGDGLLRALSVSIGLAFLSLSVDSAFILRYSRTSRLDLSPKAALNGMRATRVPTALITVFMFLASWALLSQVSNLREPRPSQFGVSDSSSLVQLRFKPDTWVSERIIKSDALLSVAREIAELNHGSPIAAVESYPGYALSLDSGDIVLEDEQTCGDAAEILRASEELLPALRVPLIAGRAPALRAEMAISNARAARCFGSVDRALGARLRLNGQWCTVVGVFRNFDWQLGRSARSEFLAPLPDLPMNPGFVTSSDLMPEQLKSILMNRLGSVQPNLREILVEPFPEVVAGLYRNETAQARQLAILAALMSLACILASSAYFSSIFRDRRPLLALYVAAGATTGTLFRRCLLPLAFIASFACFAAAVPGVRLVVFAPTPAFDGSVWLIAGAGATAVLLITSISAWQLGAALSRGALMSELKAA